MGKNAFNNLITRSHGSLHNTLIDSHIYSCILGLAKFDIQGCIFIIHGGTANAKSSENLQESAGAGIGSGFGYIGDDDDGYIIITGGTVQTQGKYSLSNIESPPKNEDTTARKLYPVEVKISDALGNVEIT